MKLPACLRRGDSRHGVPLRIYSASAAALWTAAMLGVFAWAHHTQKSTELAIALDAAQDSVELELAFFDWVFGQEGAYVPASRLTPPDAFLRVPEKDIRTPSGRRLTMISHVSAMKQFYQLRELKGLPVPRLTSLHPRNPSDAPDGWERASLENFERGQREAMTLAGGSMRYMRPLRNEEACLRCHAGEGVRVGGIRGGISTTVPLSPLEALGRRECVHRALRLFLLWALGMFGIAAACRRLGRALDEIRTLSGLLSICASCKKIRNDKGFWESVEHYLSQHSEARFSHGICPDCGKKLYGELYDLAVPEGNARP